MGSIPPGTIGGCSTAAFDNLKPSISFSVSSWDFEQVVLIPWSDNTNDECFSFGFKLGYAFALGDSLDPILVRGDGAAIDSCIGGDVFSQVSGNSSYTELWHYLGKGLGLAKVVNGGQMIGRVNLKDADCAAAALGYIEFSCSIPSANSKTALTSSAGETVPNQLGSLMAGYQGFSGSINISVGSKEGIRCQSPSTAKSGAMRLKYFSHSRLAGCLISVWANGLISAECDARMKGAWTKMDITLSN